MQNHKHKSVIASELKITWPNLPHSLCNTDFDWTSPLKMLPTIGKPFVRSQILKNAHQLTLY